MYIDGTRRRYAVRFSGYQVMEATIDAVVVVVVVADADADLS